jgi:D-ribose pyranose/furanose isomerase RbsD
LKELDYDKGIINTLEKLYEDIYYSEQNIEIKSIIMDKIDSVDLSDQLLDILSPANLDELIDAIEIEEISQKVIYKLLVQFIKIIENSHFNYQEKEKFKQKTINIKQKIKTDHIFEYKKLALDLIINYLSLETSFSFLDFKDNISDLREWKEVYQNYLSNMEFNYYQLLSLTTSLNLKDVFPQNVKYKKTRQTLNNYNKLFANFYDSRDILGEDSEKFMGNNLVYLLKEKYPKLIKKMKVDQSYCIMLDGMRWDIWEMIKNILTDRLAVRLIEEDSIFSLMPTNTEKQIKTLKESNIDLEVINQSNIINNLSELRQSKNNELDLIKFSFIDDKVHSVKDDFHKFMEEIDFQTNNRLIPFIEKIESKSGILIFSDHGFKINYGFNKNNKLEEPRYLHGGKTFHEIIVPWAFMYKP